MNLPKKVNEKLMEDTESNLKRYIQKNGGNANYTQQDVKARLKQSFIYESALKNVVIRILGEIKEKKKRLSIKEGVEKIMKKREEEERGHRMKLRKKIEDLYEDEAAQKKLIVEGDSYKKPDKLFGRVISLQDRVLKLMTA